MEKLNALNQQWPSETIAILKLWNTELFFSTPNIF